jgi:hypothetical protein
MTKDSSHPFFSPIKKILSLVHLEPSNLIKLFKDKSELKENTIIAVSNSNSDGVSALQEHYKFFENGTPRTRYVNFKNVLSYTLCHILTCPYDNHTCVLRAS